MADTLAHIRSLAQNNGRDPADRESESVLSLGAGALVLAALIVLILGEETKGKMLEAISQ